MIELFPYRPRLYQEEIMSFIWKTIQNKKHLVLESGTGSGKTICALVPSVKFALENKKRVLYLTRTNAQQRQVILELRQIANLTEVYGVGVQGRRNMCLLLKTNKEFQLGNPEELSKMCADRKRKVLTALEQGEEAKDCIYFANNCKLNLDSIEQWAKKKLPTAEEFVSYCKRRKLCPYELNKALVSDATVVTAPYIYFFEPFIRRSLFDWIACNIEEIILIVDEAHNLPDYARESNSAELSLYSLELVSKEIEEFGNIELISSIKLKTICDLMKKIILELKKEYIFDEDGLIPSSELEGELMNSLQIPSNKLNVLIENIIKYGTIIQDKKRMQRRLARSYVHTLGTFLSFWTRLEAETHVKLISNGSNPKLEIYCLDPSIATQIIKETYASIHMSGTLKPLDEYRASLELPENTTLCSYPSPFPKENRVVLYVTDVTSKYDEISKGKDIIRKMEEYLITIGLTLDRNIVAFFPSFSLLQQFLNDGIEFHIPKSIYVEQKKMGQTELMETVDKFKASTGNAMLFGVAGGRISEGMDFPDRELELAVLIGIPYPKPTAKQKALQHYYDIKFNKGWEYTVTAPTTRKMLQCIGRLIRSEKDRGVAVILDRRAVHFKKYIEDLKETGSVVIELKRFFSDLQGTK